MEIRELATIIFGAMFFNNIVLTRMLGICPLLGVTGKMDSAVSMGLAVMFVMTVTSFVTYPIYVYVLAPLGMTYMTTFIFILVIALLVQGVELLLIKIAPGLYNSLGIFLPLITTNCAVLGAAMLNISSGFMLPGAGTGLLKCVAQGFGGGVGFTLALVIMTGIRDRLELADVPENLRGIPIALITAGFLVLAFYGLSGVKI